jgi:hypothetical protein
MTWSRGRSPICGRNRLVAVRRSVGRGLFWAGLIAAAFGVAVLGVPSRAGAQEAKVRLEVPATDLTAGRGQFPVDVIVDDVANLGAFQFTLSYDAALLQFVDVHEGAFLGSSGRIVDCLDPRVEPGSVVFVCVTLGPNPPGSDGSGTLATVTLNALGTGTTPLQLGGLTLAQPDAQRIAAGSEDAVITLAAGAVHAVSAPAATQTAAPPVTAPTTPAETAPTAPPVTAPTTPAETAATAPTETAPTVATAEAAATEAVPAEGTPTFVASPAPAETTDGGGTNWALWGSVIGVVAVLIVVAAGVAWWSRARRAT